MLRARRLLAVAGRSHGQSIRPRPVVIYSGTNCQRRLVRARTTCAVLHRVLAEGEAACQHGSEHVAGGS